MYNPTGFVQDRKGILNQLCIKAYEMIHSVTKHYGITDTC